MAGFDKNKIQECLIAISDDSINHSQLTELVRISRLMIQSYLINYRSKVLDLITRNGITLTDLSYDCIADAFARNEENKFHIIKKFISSLNPSIKEIEVINLFLAYKSFLIKITEAQLSKLYSQSDPIGSKILRNVKDVVRGSDKFIIVKNLRGLTLVASNYDELYCKPEFPLEKIITEFNMQNNGSDTHSLLGQLHQILVNQNEYRRSILLIDTVSLLKKYFSAEINNTYDVNGQLLLSPVLNDGFEEYETTQVKQKVENYIKEKILLDYFVKGKINKEEAESIYLTIQDIINDWYYGVETKDSIYKYFTAHQQTEKEEYLKNYMTKIEYLVKLARDEFANYLLKEI